MSLSFTLDIESSDDEDREWTEKVREQHKILKAERADKRRKERADKLSAKLSDITKREKAMNQVCSLTHFLALTFTFLLGTFTSVREVANYQGSQ